MEINSSDLINKLKKICQSKKYFVYWIVYTILFLLIYCLAYSAFRIHGKSYIWNMDGIRQHYASMVYIGRYLREIIKNLLSGNFVLPMYDTAIGMGDDIIATFNFYGLGEPLLLLSVFVPSVYMEKFYCFLVIFRMYLAGAAFSGMCFYFKKSRRAVLPGALSYAFCGYALHVAVKHPFFIIPMIYLPVMIIGADKIIKKKKPYIFLAAVFVGALNGFYFLYMSTIAVGVFILVRTLNYYKEKRILALAKCIGKSIGVYVIGVMMSAVVFLPAITGYLSSSRSDSSVVVKNFWSYGRDYYRKMFAYLISPPAITWSFVGMSAVILFAIALMFRKKNGVSLELRVTFTIALIFMLLPVGGYVMNGFSYTSGRWLFIFALVSAIAVVEMFPHLEDMDFRNRILSLAVVAAYFAVVLSMKKSVDIYAVMGMAMLALTLSVFWIDKIRRNVKYGIILMVIIVNLVVNGNYLFENRGYVQAFMNKEETLGIIEGTNSAVVKSNGDFYRVDAASYTSENAGILTHVNGVSSYFSIMNANTISYNTEMENAAVLDSMFKIRGVDSRTFLETLAGVRYYVAEESEMQYVPYGFVASDELSKDGLTVYENQYYLPLGYTYDKYMERDVYDSLSPLGKQEALLEAALLETDPEGIDRIKPDISSRKISYNIEFSEGISWEEGTIKVEEDNAYIQLSFAGAEECETYVRIVGLNSNDSGNEYINMSVRTEERSSYVPVVSNTWNWYCGRENYLFNLGYRSKACDSCRIAFSKRGTYRMEDIEIYVQPMKQYAKRVQALKENVLGNVICSTNRVCGRITLEREKLVCFSIPYSKGWTAKIDGEKAEILKCNTMYMAVNAKKGTHTIELVYETPYLKMGGCVSLLGLALFAGLVFLYRHMEKKAV